MNYTREQYQEMVSRPGKFEGEPEWTPYFWECWLNGDGEAFDDNGMYITRLEITNADRDLFPSIPQQAAYVEIWEQDNGFVYCDLLDANLGMLCF